MHYGQPILKNAREDDLEPRVRIDDIPSQPPQDLARLIRKLRWIGMDDEACRLQTVVAALPADARGVISAEPFGTD
jgi:hypothetical protein